VQHDVGDRVEPARAQILGARDEVAGGVVDEVGERTGLEDVSHHGVDRARIANVDAVGLDPALIFPGEFGGRCVAHCLAPSADEDIGAERQEFFHHALAEAGAAAGHQDAPAAKKSVLEHLSPFRFSGTLSRRRPTPDPVGQVGADSGVRPHGHLGLVYAVRMSPMQKCSTPSQFWAKSRNAALASGEFPWAHNRPGRKHDSRPTRVTREEKTT
jgi:hypothetical protein